MAENSESPGCDGQQETEEQQFLASFITEIVRSPVNIALVCIIATLVYKIFKSKTRTEVAVVEAKVLPKLRRDFTNQELKKYDGRGPDGRILVAVNGSVYDVTKGSKFYGPGGPYEAFAGKDASRCLATFSVAAVKEEYDDLSDLDTTEMNSIKEWEEQFKEKYDYVGKLLKPQEAPTNYSDEEDEGSQQETETTPAQVDSEIASGNQTDKKLDQTHSETIQDKQNADKKLKQVDSELIHNQSVDKKVKELDSEIARDNQSADKKSKDD